jgi:Fe-S-cluster containining protein
MAFCVRRIGGTYNESLVGIPDRIDPFGLVQLVPAGNFFEWLRSTEASLQAKTGGADVPCGACTACCRSSMFVHIGPEEKQTIGRIPRALLFPAPGWPEGHLLMGYDDQGRCPMLAGDRCSIYEDRPRICREYDCRVFAATGIRVDPQTQADIARRVQEWVFDYENEASRQEHARLEAAAVFLEKNRGLFPPGSLPDQPGQLAALAIRIHTMFAGMVSQSGTAPPSSDIVHAIIAQL